MIITTTHTKGGVGKSALTILKAKALSSLGKKVLVIDMDFQNHTTSYYFNEGVDPELVYEKNIYNVFDGKDIKNNIIKVWGVDFINSDTKLSKYRTISKNTLSGLLEPIKNDYDYILIDTTPSHDNIIANTYFVSDVIIIPTLINTSHYQVLKYMLNKINEYDIENPNIKIVINQFKKIPINAKEDSYKTQIHDMFNSEEMFKPYYLKTKIINSEYIPRFIDDKEFRIKKTGPTKVLLKNINDYLNEVIKKKVKLEVI